MFLDIFVFMTAVNKFKWLFTKYLQNVGYLTNLRLSVAYLANFFKIKCGGYLPIMN